MPKRIALLDSTVQIDRKKSASRCVKIEATLKEFEHAIATSICLLEFKATLIQECITIHDRLRSVGRYSRVVDELTESSHRQAKLRGHVFRNLVNVFAPSSFEITAERDRRLADKCRLLLESVIPKLYNWFTGSVLAVLKVEVNCTRADEPPVKKRVAFAVNLPECRRGENKFCRIEDFIRTKAGPLLSRLEERVRGMSESESAQLSATCDLVRSVIEDPHAELSHRECRRAGDFLIALEGMGQASHALSTNAREWEIVSEITGMEFVHVGYSDD